MNAMQPIAPLSTHDRIWILAPHPDDETLGTGGLIQRACQTGAAVCILFATRGDKNPWGQALFERTPFVWSDEAAERYAGLRREETWRTLDVLGFKTGPDRQVEFLEWHDQSGTSHLLTDSAQAISALRESIVRFRPTRLFLPALQDAHPDHSALAVLARLALGTDLPFSAPDVYAYLIHQSKREKVSGQPVALTLTPEECATKRRAIECYVSQLVFKPQRFLRFAAEEENYLHESPVTLPAQSSWPVQMVSIQGDQLHVRIQSKIPERWGGTRLHLIGVSADKKVCTATLPLTGSREISLPLSSLGAPGQLFIKFESGCSFFNKMGWLHVLCQ
jgi:LmbE family N-acetylglucosaminyl deacetylase